MIGEWSRYSGQGMILHAANYLGCSKAAEVIDVSDENDKISHSSRYNATLLSISSGKTSLSQIDELIDEEFEAICGSFPKKSSNHEYWNKVVRVDVEQVEQGKLSIIGTFVDMSSKGYYNANIIRANRVYIDKHVAEVNTKEDIARDMHGTKDKIVKSIAGYWVVDAETKNPITFEMFCGGHVFSKLLKPFMNKMENLFEKPVELIGVDKGAYNYQEITNALEDNEDTCIVVWSKETPITIKALEDISNEKFEPYEVENLKNEENSLSIKVLNSIADAGEITIDKKNHMVRTVVIQNELSGRRIGIFVFGKKAQTLDKKDVADFLYGKQDVENHFKERKKLGSDKFCGGTFSKIELPEPTKEERIKIENRVNSIEKKLPKIEQDIVGYNELLKKEELSKTDYNHLNIKAEKTKIRLEKELDKLKTNLASENGNHPLNDKPTSTLDVRKTTVLSQIQDHVLVCRKLIINLFIECLIVVLTKKYELCKNHLKYSISERVSRQVKNINITKLASRLFEQGGNIYKSKVTNELIVVMKDYDSFVMQSAYELLCERFKHRFNTTIEVDKVTYKLIYTTENNFRKKYSFSKESLDEVC